MQENDNNKEAREQIRNTKQDVDIASILVDIGWIKSQIGEIKDNHLKSIYCRLECIERKLNERPTWLMAGLVSLCIALLMFIITSILV